jgi:PKD repeat protein
MKNLGLKLFAIILLAVFFHACNVTDDPQVDPIDSHLKSGLNTAIEKLQDVMDLQDKVTDALFNNPEVVGTGTGIDANGNPTIVVYTISKVQQRADVNIQNIGRGAHPTALPVSIENVPVVPIVTGMFKAYADPTARFARPVPIGVSTGHPDITAGTIGCRVKDSQGNVYALSNNHVYANSNNATLGDNVLQPGPYDGGTDPADAIGTLYDFELISFSNNNYMDAAIAYCSTNTLGTSTPSGDGYGTPNSSTMDASIGLNVQKYGRTTSWTHGEIAEINVTVDVCYETRGPFNCVKAARFVNQISITPGTFSGGGDSGSLIVTDDDSANPVGLLFAGSTDRTIASPIGVVLERFGVTIDDGSGGTTNNPPTAGFSYSAIDLTVSFTDQSTDSDGEIASWSWDFGDGNSSTLQNPSHTYASDGNFTVTLTVTDDDGATGNVSKNVTVSTSGTTNDPPVANFTYTANGLEVTFTDTSTDSDGNIIGWSWNFGDGNTSTNQNTSHTYGSGGTYTVSLTVTDDDGDTGSLSQDVTVSEPTTDDITLTATGRKVRGRHHIDFSWSGANSTNVDIYVDNVIVNTTSNDGSYTHSTTNVGGGSYLVKVCEAGTSTCSNEVTVTF